MNNIKQITNFDISSAQEIREDVIAGGDIGYDKHGGKIQMIYKKINNTYLIKNINKFGYCCEPKAIQFPIFITFSNNVKKEFQIGKTGMFEIQPETWRNVNDETMTDEETAIINISEIEVPWRKVADEVGKNYQGYNFKLDFIYNIN